MAGGLFSGGGDSSGGLLLQPGTSVVVVGLNAAPQLNGLVGTVVERDHATGRWRVDLGKPGIKALKLDNLDVPGHLDSREPAGVFGLGPGVQPAAKLSKGAITHGALRPGVEVFLEGLNSAPHLNGTLATVLDLDCRTSRWLVDLGEEGVKSFKADNLVVRAADWSFHEGPECFSRPTVETPAANGRPGPGVAVGASSPAVPAVHAAPATRPQEPPVARPPPANVDRTTTTPSASAKVSRETQAQDARFQETLAPPQEATQAAERCIDAISKVAKRLNASVVLFGSWAQDTPLRGSDMDVALLFDGQFEPDGPDEKAEKIQRLRCFIARSEGSGLQVVEQVFKARVPIVQMEFVACSPPLEVDVSVGSSATGMLDDTIRGMVQEVPRSVPLLRLVKRWASRRNINKALFACLNSLSWTLLVLCFAWGGLRGGGADTRGAFGDFLGYVRGFGDRPDQTRKLSVRQRRWVARSPEDAYGLLWIEDPTISTNNTSRSLQLSSWQATLDELDRALSMCHRGELLEAICSDDAPSRIDLAPPGLRQELEGRGRKRQRDARGRANGSPPRTQQRRA